MTIREIIEPFELDARLRAKPGAVSWARHGYGQDPLR